MKCKNLLQQNPKSPIHLIALCINAFLIYLFPFVITLVRTGVPRSLTTQQAYDSFPEEVLHVCKRKTSQLKKGHYIIVMYTLPFNSLSSYGELQFSKEILMYIVICHLFFIFISMLNLCEQQQQGAHCFNIHWHSCRNGGTSVVWLEQQEKIYYLELLFLGDNH